MHGLLCGRTYLEGVIVVGVIIVTYGELCNAKEVGFPRIGDGKVNEWYGNEEGPGGNYRSLPVS